MEWEKGLRILLLILLTTLSFPVSADGYGYITRDWCNANFENSKRMFDPCLVLATSIDSLNKGDIDTSLRFLDSFALDSIERINQSAYLQFGFTKKVGDKTIELMMAYKWWLNSTSVAASAMSDSYMQHGYTDKAYQYHQKSLFYLSAIEKIEFYD